MLVAARHAGPAAAFDYCRLDAVRLDPCKADATERAAQFDAVRPPMVATEPSAQSEGSGTPPRPGAGQRKVFAISPWACDCECNFATTRSEEHTSELQSLR